MLISNEWLKEYVTIDDSVSNLAERITRTGIEVDDLIEHEHKRYQKFSCRLR
ncbi:hypothetical protein ACVXZY_06285 [Staphylococcus aureus]